MGLGETAEGAATALALLLLAGAVLLVPVIYLVARTVAGRRRPAFVAVGVWCALLLVLVGAPNLSADARAQRQVASARDDVLDAAGEELGGDGTLIDDLQSSPCPAGSGEPTSADGKLPVGYEAWGYGTTTHPDVLDRFAAALRETGYAVTTAPLAPDASGVRDRPGSKVVGIRDPASVVVIVDDDSPDRFYLQVETGCLGTPER